MWSELYINDPDILSDVTEIAVKKLGYWIERRLREGRSSPPPRTFYLYRVLLNMWDTFRESTFHVGSRNGRNCCSPPCLRSHVDEPISIQRMKNKNRSEFDRYGKKKAKFLATFVANVIIVDDSPMFPYRISCTILHVPRITGTATSIIPSHHEIIRPVVHRGSDRSILFADLPVSRIRVAQSVSSSFGFPDNTRNTPVHFCRLRFPFEGETRRERFYIEIGTRGSSSESGRHVVDRESDPVSIG